MNIKKHLNTFQKAADQLDQSILNPKKVEVATGITLDSVFLKLYKKSWANPSPDPLSAESRIFFAIWVNDATLAEGKIFYNIHALKLRKLKGYAIASRKFADTFRASFQPFAPQWPNVSVKFGPLTLMEGWLAIDVEDFQDEILELANNFLEIGQLVDETLLRFKK